MPELLDQKYLPLGPFMKNPPGYLKKFSMKACRYRVVNGSPIDSMYSCTAHIHATAASHKEECDLISNVYKLAFHSCLSLLVSSRPCLFVMAPCGKCIISACFEVLGGFTEQLKAAQVF